MRKRFFRWRNAIAMERNADAGSHARDKHAPKMFAVYSLHQTEQNWQNFR